MNDNSRNRLSRAALFAWPNGKATTAMLAASPADVFAAPAPAPAANLS